MNKDLEQMKLLSLGYYIYGTLSALFYLVPLVFIFAGVVLMRTPAVDERSQDLVNQAPMFIFIGIFFFLYGQITSIATILVGRYIKKTKNYLFCLIVAGINCISFPIGTALGVATFVVLTRDSIKNLFNAQQPTAFDNTQPS